MSVTLLQDCKPRKKPGTPLFKVLNSQSTGLDFSNNLTYNQQFNLFKYIYFYNGSGLGAGDFNNDGLIDLFFGSNQEKNKLYLNTGNLKFKDVTNEAKIPEDGGWTTGISVVDINNDGLLDIYICRVGNYETLHSKNQLLINQGIDKNGVPTFVDKAHEYGLDFSGFSTQAVFFDYDMDGDLDMFLLNHSVHENGTFQPRNKFLGTYHPLSGDRLYRNNSNSSMDTAKAQNIFTDVTKQSGINSSAIGYGLGIATADVNLDGYPDIYITNDFHENDYLYINQKDGTFKEEGEQRLMHTSQFSMGVDMADITNDGYPEIISTDMLSSDPYILKRSLSEGAYNIFNYKIGIGYSYQYTRNNLQLNNRNGMFSEIGLYSGIAATDWSWSPLLFDFDNDGLKDLFISNGIPKRLNDIDYINFVSNGDVQQKIQENNFREKDLALIDKFPVIKLPDKFFKNNGNAHFTDENNLIDGSVPTFSNGAVYADLDNDGDVDIAVNSIDASALIYENKTSEPGKRSSIQIKLKGSPRNINAIGAKIILFANKEIRTYENYPVKGFMSSMQIPVTIGLNNTKVDSAFVIWPDNSYQRIFFSSNDSSVIFSYKKSERLFDYNTIIGYYKNPTIPMTDITKDVSFNYKHEENRFSEFDRDPLIPHFFSTEGPALAIADINHDRLEDVFIGSARNKKSCIFLQQPSGEFIKSKQPVLDKDSIYENVDACFTDVNNDGNIDLVIASGGNEFYGNESHNTPRVYLNDGQANFTNLDNAFHDLYLTASSVVPYDFNGDGFVDLFIGARTVPWEYGEIPQSYLLQNDGSGKFKDVTSQYANGLAKVGFVTQALWFDIDKDGDKDLLLSLEWGGIVAFINDKGKFTKKILSDKKGWWNFILPCDVDNDGDIDFVAGNLGLNSRLKASVNEPVKLYFNDFDDNGKKEQVLTYYLGGKEIPFASKAELEKQIPLLKKKFLYAEDFAKASLAEIFSSDKLEHAEVLSADYFSNAILINNGNLQFDTRALPWQAQLTSCKDAVIVNANDDDLPDILLMGNYYENNIEMGRYDAGFGTILVNKGKGQFLAESINGLQVKGQVRHIKKINLGKQYAYILARNNDSAMVIKFDYRQKINK
ncbi:MAG TPA: VCBS repeat-containing protein [Chitinophagaceae bacterium]|nr:VCBS repeat-containing protein [Chitinophagaceae bacterium]